MGVGNNILQALDRSAQFLNIDSFNGEGQTLKILADVAHIKADNEKYGFWTGPLKGLIARYRFETINGEERIMDTANYKFIRALAKSPASVGDTVHIRNEGTGGDRIVLVTKLN